MSLYWSAMADTERLGTSKSILGAIGRPLDPAWTDHFADVARSILPSTVTLHMRKLPGVVYIPGGNLPRNLGLEAADDEARHTRLQKYASSMIMSLSEQSLLDKEAALNPMDVSLHKARSISVKQPRGGHITTIVELDDIPSSPAEDGDYQIQSERKVFLDEFPNADPIMASTRQLPMYHVAIGRMTGFAPRQTLTEIGLALQEPVPLLGIGALNIGLED